MENTPSMWSFHLSRSLVSGKIPAVKLVRRFLAILPLMLLAACQAGNEANSGSLPTMVKAAAPPTVTSISTVSTRTGEPAKPTTSPTSPPAADLSPTSEPPVYTIAATSETNRREATITPSPMPSPAITVTPSPTDQMAITIPVPLDMLDRSCPDPSPERPDYRHTYLSATAWPTPQTEIESHLWLSKPLPGGGRLLFTDWFPYGYDVGGRYLIHNGIDMAEPLGTPVLAAAGGTVVVAGEDSEMLYGWRCDWYGQLVVIELDDRWLDQPVYLLYGHVLNITVEVGQPVERGQQVAEVGFGGAATLPHLHFEVRVSSNEFRSTRNPFLWLKPPATRGIIVGRLIDPEGRPWQGVVVAAVGRSEGSEDSRTWTYLSDPDPVINPDEGLAENFVIADLKPGRYELFVELQNERYTVEVNVKGGEISLVEIVTLPLKTATPTPVDAAVTPDLGTG